MRTWRTFLRWFYAELGPEEAEALSRMSLRGRSRRLTEIIRARIPDPREYALRRALTLAESLESRGDVAGVEALRTKIEALRSEPIGPDSLREFHQALSEFQSRLPDAGVIGSNITASPSLSERGLRLDRETVERLREVAGQHGHAAEHAFRELQANWSEFTRQSEGGASLEDLQCLHDELEIAEAAYLELARRARYYEDVRQAAEWSYLSITEARTMQKVIGTHLDNCLDHLRESLREAKRLRQGLDRAPREPSRSEHAPESSHKPD